MKIGMLLEAPFPPDLRVENEMRTLADAGHKIILFCLKHDKIQQNEKFSKGIFLQRNYIPKLVFNKIRTTVLRLPFYAKMWIHFISNDYRLDAIHVHDLPLARVGQYLSEKLNTPLVLDLHENYPAAIQTWGHNKRSLGRYLYKYQAWIDYEKQAVQTANKVIVVVDEAKERLIKTGTPAEKIVVISNTLNLSNLKLPPDTTKHKSVDEFIITYVGGFGEHRGLQIAIKAMPEIIKQNQKAKLVLIGDGNNRNNLEKLANDLKLKKNVIFTGWLKLNDAMQKIRESHICIIPYLATEHTETTIPHKLFQYMYFGKAVVVSNCRPLERIVSETGSGLVFKSGNTTELANSILRLYGNKSLRTTMSKNGMEAVLRKYNWKNTASKLIELYNNFNEKRSHK
ncbi:MAG: glycosyltransferase family 4 protein [Candidatus Hodarchaeota archaeon]